MRLQSKGWIRDRVGFVMKAISEPDKLLKVAARHALWTKTALQSLAKHIGAEAEPKILLAICERVSGRALTSRDLLRMRLPTALRSDRVFEGGNRRRGSHPPAKKNGKRGVG